MNFLIAGVVILAVLLLGSWWAAAREKNFGNGLYFWERLSLYKRGAVATGTVMNVVEVRHLKGGGQWRGDTSLSDLVVDVEPESGAPFRVSMRYNLSFIERDLVRTNAVVPLRYDAANPKHVVIHWPTLLSPPDVAGANAGKKAAALAEREALLGGKSKE